MYSVRGLRNQWPRTVMGRGTALATSLVGTSWRDGRSKRGQSGMEKVSECWQEGISQNETPYKDTCSHLLVTTHKDILPYVTGCR